MSELDENGKRWCSRFHQECFQEERGQKQCRGELDVGGPKSGSGGSVSGARSPSRLAKAVVEQSGRRRLSLVEALQVQMEESEGAGLITQQSLESTLTASTSLAPPSVGCSLCGASVPGWLLGQHLHLEHFSWYFAPELSCWACRVAVATSSDLRSHQLCGVTFSAGNLGRWLEAMRTRSF